MPLLPVACPPLPDGRGLGGKGSWWRRPPLFFQILRNTLPTTTLLRVAAAIRSAVLSETHFV